MKKPFVKVSSISNKRNYAKIEINPIYLNRLGYLIIFDACNDLVRKISNKKWNVDALEWEISDGKLSSKWMSYGQRGETKKNCVDKKTKEYYNRLYEN